MVQETVTEDVKSWAGGSSASDNWELILNAQSCLQKAPLLCSVADGFHLAAGSMLYCIDLFF